MSDHPIVVILVRKKKTFLYISSVYSHLFPSVYFIFNQIATCLGVGGWALEKLQESVGKGSGDGEELENEGPGGDCSSRVGNCN